MNILRLHTKLLITLVIISLTCGCTPNEQWRNNLNEDCSADKSNTNCVLEKNDNYDLGFLEFTERGNLFDTNTKKIILDQIDFYSKKKEGVAVIVFVHGWKHNASFKDKNVRSFKKALETISTNKKEIFGNRKIFGVYLGWRGLSLHGLGSENFTYWDRKSVAQEVGNGGVTDILLNLDQIDKSNSNNILFVVGHSFGGAVVLSAIDEILLDRVISKKYNKDMALSNFGDGIILINPAIEANQILDLEDIAQEISGSISNEQKIIHVIDSEGDIANKIAFPIGQFLGTALTWNQEIIHRNYNGDSYTLSEYDLDLTTVGNYKPFHTANLIEKKGKIQELMASNGDILMDWEYIDCCRNLEECNLSNNTETHISCQETLPISFLYTSKSFINDHNDVFNNNVFAYFSTIVSESLSQQSRKPFKGCTDQNSGKFNFGNCFNFHYEKITNQQTIK